MNDFIQIMLSFNKRENEVHKEWRCKIKWNLLEFYM